MEIFVSGATRRVGGVLTAALMKRGHNVRTIVLPGDAGARVEPGRSHGSSVKARTILGLSRSIQ